MTWKRPSGVFFPKIWHTFQAMGPDFDEKITYEIRDLLPEHFDDACTLMQNCFLREAPVASAVRAFEDPASVKDFIERWRISINQKMALGCYPENSCKLVGVSFLAVISKNDVPSPLPPPVEPTASSTGDVVEQHGVAYRKAYQFYCDVDAKLDVFQRFNVDYCLKSYGVTVSHAYRNRGIATQILKARIPILQEFQIPITYSLFTANSSQRAATKAGFTAYCEIE